MKAQQQIPFFRDVIGHHDLLNRLKAYKEEHHMPHALLFMGDEGSEAMPIALAFTRYLQCERPVDGDACGMCRSCKQLNTLSHPDVYFSFPIAKLQGVEMSDDCMDLFRTFMLKHDHPVFDDWVETLNSGNKQLLIPAKESDSLAHKLSYKSYQSPYRIVVIWSPERMHMTCANKILKLLEEPPQGVIFLMVSSNPGQLLPTVYSRLQRISLPPLQQAEIEQALMNRLDVSPEEASEVAHLSCGNYYKATRFLDADNHRLLARFSEAVRLLSLPIKGVPKEMKSMAEALHDRPREDQTGLLDEMTHVLREVIAIHTQQAEVTYIPKSELEQVRKISQYIKPSKAIVIMQEIIKARREIAQNVSTKILFFDFLLTLTSVYHQPSQ